MPTPSLNSAALRQLEKKGFTAGMIQALPDSSVVHYNKIYQEQTGSYDTPPPTAPTANQTATVAERLEASAHRPPPKTSQTFSGPPEAHPPQSSHGYRSHSVARSLHRMSPAPHAARSPPKGSRASSEL